MVEIKKIKKGNKKYYYLTHSYREGKSVKKKQLYLGDSIPKDIEKQKKKFIQEFYKEKFLKNIDKIKTRYVLWLKPTGKYELVPQTNIRDEALFLSFANAFNFIRE